MFALYFCDNDGEESQISRLNMNLLGEIDNWPPNFFGDPLGESAAIATAGLRRRVAASQ